MFFVESFSKSLYDLAWLKAHRAAARQAWGYFLLWSGALSLILTIILSFVFYSAAGAAQTAVSAWPNFTGTLHSGVLSVTGFTEPYVYKTGTNSNFVVVVDTGATSSPVLASFLTSGESGLLVARDHIELFDVDTTQSRSQSWSDFPDYTVTKAGLIQSINTQIHSGWVALYVAGLLVITYVALTIAMLLTVLAVTIIAYLLSRIMRRGWWFLELFTISLFAVTLPTLIAILFAILGLGSNGIFFLALLAFMLAVVMTRDENEIAEEAEEGTD